MDERVMQFRVGAVVLATLLITLILVILFGEGPDIMKKRVTIHMVFTEAPMVMENTPVKKSGVMLGRVTKVELLEDGRVRVSASIDDNKPVYSTDVARINASLIGADAVVNLEPGRKPAPRERVADDAEIQGSTYTDPIQVISNLQDRLAGAIGSVTNTSNELGQVVHQVGQLLQTNQEKINRIVVQADDASKDVKDLVRGMNDTFGNPETKAKIKDAADQVPELIRTTRETVGQFNRVINGLDKNLQNVDKFTTALGDQGQVTIMRLGRSAEKFDQLLEQLLIMSKTINSGEGTLGQLVSNRELYDNLNRTVVNVEAMSVKLKPIVEDLRVLSDSLARHPEKLGVRGAIERSPGTKW
jgi:phospholipid/cholesterol/gamma-HCH transport system substrate-binding protein